MAHGTSGNTPYTGADALCDTLLAGGVDVCFANPGTSEMHFVAALDRRPRMRCVLGLFEGVVTGAADGYARMADKPAVTLLHCGPGLANGLANLHNARRARSPVVNVVGDHATYHRAYDAPLTSDVEGLARPMSDWVRSTDSAATVARDAAEAIRTARTAPGRIATLILPADAAWGQTSSDLPPLPAAPAAEVSEDRVAEAAAAIRSRRRTVLLLTGRALRAPALVTADRIARAAGVRLLAQQSNARIERGAGRVPVERVPYPLDGAIATFRDVEQVILVGAAAPVAFFAYPGRPSSLLPDGCRILTLAEPEADLPGALAALADALGIGPGSHPLVQQIERPAMIDGALTPDSIAAALGALMPEGAILCDEALTSGRRLFELTRGAPPHDFLALTGGSIGIGLPLATGAAVACPDRKVVALQADGSGMYTAQALWTQAREGLDVVTIVFANRSYAILRNEYRSVGAGEPGRNADRLFDLVDPVIDWTGLAKSMGVEAARVEDSRAFADRLSAAFRRKGPFLIEAVI
ncbi:acetolactate synthase large subunit [Azospirillum sp. YIM B02556]|uniref:Acetolactate synthase large subunit n=1 Tax=Azospirillum endophyticum TaxID=2800326 RepID=A0ABS1FAS8_9PROT|nr:acetolactate synthase large subunit [Azospirillum endophyticum]MBK1840526.1 acetolactate synthase large subunit [Azospirillum endophyticum]